MDEINKAILLGQISKVNSGVTQNKLPAKESGGANFDSILEQSSLQFSKHAEKRLLSRQISLSDADKSRLESAVGSLEKKGAKDSLILMGELAFVVNVPSKTVVTALSKDQMKEHVFTNIDSTMLVEQK